MLTQTNGPIYIGGPDRCGKTLLAAIVGSHSRIAIPIVGSNLWSYFYGQYGDLSNERNFESCLAALQQYKHARFIGIDSERIREQFAAGDPSYARLFALVHQQYADRHGKPRWGDQTGLVERYADEIFAAYPGVRMIQMVRDPRDRYEASLRMWPQGQGRAGAAVARWRYSYALGEKNVRRYGDRYRLLRYEDLVADPTGVTREICAFLGEEFEPTMLELAAAPKYREKLEEGRDSDNLISARHVGSFRGHLEAADLAFIQQQLTRQMSELGYAPEPTPMTPGQRLRYVAVRWPSHALRRFAWEGLETIQRRLPQFSGRRPSAAMIVDK
jgi:hypothetical protein